MLHLVSQRERGINQQSLQVVIKIVPILMIPISRESLDTLHLVRVLMIRPAQDARAAQNRKAQQVYRRKREDKMKELEAQVALLGDVKHNLSLAESKLKELALVSRSTTSSVTY
jgi:hypothetical protein